MNEENEKTSQNLHQFNVNASIGEQATFLRAKAIEHLRKGKGTVVEGFRKEYKSFFGVPYASFLKKQEKNGVWGTYIELSALAELYGVKVIVTSRHNGKESSWVLYEPENKTCPTVYVHCNENTHFTYKGLRVDGKYYPYQGNTLGDGNCLYNAMAQAVKTYSALKQNVEMIPEEIKQDNVDSNFILDSQLAQLRDYNKGHGIEFKENNVVTPYNPHELMDRMLAIEYSLSEEKRVYGKKRSQAFFKESNSCSKELTDEEKINLNTTKEGSLVI